MNQDKNNAEWLPSDVEELRSEIRYLEKHYDRKFKQCNELLTSLNLYKELSRDLHHKCDETITRMVELEIAVDEFLKRHPDHIDEFFMIKKQAEKGGFNE